ncbi:MAG: NAD(P)-dependent oxidoreductase [Anaerolineales bacterium]
MTILVTGAAGFIGSHLTARLLGQNKKVRALALPNEKIPTDWQDRVEVIRGDIRDRAAVEKAVNGVDTIFHLAAITLDTGPRELHQQVTVEGTRHIVEAAAAHKAKVILTSSVTVYGVKIQTDVLNEELEWGQPAGFYSTHKQLQEKLARELAQKHNIELVVIRPGNVYGPHSPQWVNSVLSELKRGTPTLLGGGHGDCGFVYMDNLVDAFILASENPKAIGRIYNIGDGFGLTWRQYFTDLANIANAPQPKIIPRWLGRALAGVIEPVWYGLKLKGRPPLTYEAFNLVASNFQFPSTRAKEELGYTPKVSYEQAMEAIKKSL